MHDDHFSAVAGQYRDLRTTDAEPVEYIRERLPDRPSIGVDVGCGTGRYTEMLLERLPRGSAVLAADGNLGMLRSLRKQTSSGEAIVAVVSRAEALPMRDDGADWITTFNALHHFDLPSFLSRTAAVLKPGGRLFIYTRTPEMNASSVWGRLFPGFLEKETRLRSEESLKEAVVEAEGLRFESSHIFSYERSSSPERLKEQAEGRHYSTFSLYGENEFAEALRSFMSRLPSPVVRWTDANLLLVCRRSGAA